MNKEEMKAKLQRLLFSRKFWAMVVAIAVVSVGQFVPVEYKEFALTILGIIGAYAGLSTLEDISYNIGNGAKG